MYEDQLKGGLRFPLHKLIKDILGHWEISLAQLAPNAFRQICGFIACCRFLGFSPNLDLFRHFFLIRVISKNSGQFYFASRPRVAHLVGSGPSSIKHWKKKFFFVDLKQVGVSKPWNYAPNLPNDRPEISEQNARKIQHLSGLSGPLDIEHLSEIILSDAKISSAPLPKSYNAKGNFLLIS